MTRKIFLGIHTKEHDLLLRLSEDIEIELSRKWWSKFELYFLTIRKNKKVIITHFSKNKVMKDLDVGQVNSVIDWIYDNLIENKDKEMQDNIDKLPPEQDYIDTAGVFWLVWTPQGGHPKYRHSTRELAETESARLATKEPEKEFYVLKTVSKVNVEFKVHKVNFE